MHNLIRLAIACLFFHSFLVVAAGLEDSRIMAELQRAQTAPDSVASVSIAAPREFVFDFLIKNPHRYTADAVAVAFDHSSAELPGEPGRGSERVITLSSGESLAQRFLAFEAPLGYAYLTDMARSTVSLPLNYSIARYALSDADGGSTRLQVALVYEPSSRLLALFVRRAFRAALQRDFEKAADIIEAEWEGFAGRSDSDRRHTGSRINGRD